MIKPLGRKGTAVFAVVDAAGLLLFGAAAWLWWSDPALALDAGPWSLALLTLLTSRLALKIPGLESLLSPSDVFVYLTVLLYGPAPATVAAGLEGFLTTRRHNRRWLSAVTSLAALAISVAAAGLTLEWLARWTAGAGPAELPLARLLVPLWSMAVVHFALNTSVVALLTGLARRRSALRIWRDCYAGTALSYVFSALAAALAFVLLREYGWTAIAAGLPVILVTYFTYRSYHARVEQKNARIREMSGVHLRALEALAEAIDAREQSDPSHLGRLQSMAAELGRLVDLKEEQIDGLRAAALLHDVGKLAVPDHILNKRGPLSPAEEAKLRTYPRIGGEILAGVGFPTPVAPTVRSHRENWDGSGFPDGLAGEAIPLPARILRIAEEIESASRAGQDEIARAEIAERLIRGAGRLFDPDLAHLAAENVGRILDAAASARAPATRAAGEIARNRSEPVQERRGESERALGDISAARREVAALFDCARDLAESLELDAACRVLVRFACRVTGCDAAAVLLAEPGEQMLRPAFAFGPELSVEDLQPVDLERGLCGRCHRTQQSICDEPASEELALLGVTFPAEVVTTIPLRAGTQPVGVLALFFTEARGAGAEPVRLVEAAAPQAASAIRNALSYERSRSRAMSDELTGLPNSRFLFAQLGKELSRARRTGRPFAVAVLDLDGFKPINDRFGHAAGDVVLKQVGAHLRSAVRTTDTVGRWGGDEFVAVLPEIDPEKIGDVLRRLQRGIESHPFELPAGGSVSVGASLGWAIYPEDGESYEELLRIADKRMYRDKASRRGTLAR